MSWTLNEAVLPPATHRAASVLPTLTTSHARLVAPIWCLCCLRCAQGEFDVRTVYVPPPETTPTGRENYFEVHAWVCLGRRGEVEGEGEGEPQQR